MTEKYDITDYLKDDKELQKAVIEEFLKENAELKAENEQLKALCDTYKTCYQAKHSDIKCLFIKYKQTLQEIKEIAENIVNNDDKPSCVNDADCPLNGGLGYDNHCNTKCPFILGKHILQKISEVEG